MPKALDLTGQRHGRLVVQCRAIRPPGSRNAMWECKCDCGRRIAIAASNIGKTTFSCGCLQVESATASLRINSKKRDGLHGRSHTAEWGIWSRMKDRCYNPNNAKYHRYGGRGIRVCQRWLESFENFFADMGLRPSKRHSIDRKDNDGDYCPENCHWATMKVQGRNTSTNNWITIDGITLCLEDWCRTLNIPRWKPYEMTRSRNGRPAQFPSISAAIEHLHGGTFAKY